VYPSDVGFLLGEGRAKISDEVVRALGLA
jgi:hypothetical protein